MPDTPAPLPYQGRRTEDVPGHWLLAQLGKRVLRPGGMELTQQLLDHAGLADADVVELAPGLGRTATVVLTAPPRSYVGVEKDPDAAHILADKIGDRGRCVVADAAETGLPSGQADVVLAEAMLTMQSDRGKQQIVAEAVRLLRPGGRYAIHELGLAPDDLDGTVKTELRKDLARTIKVNARPLTVAEWRELLESNGLVVDWTSHAPMALLKVRRNIADEGFGGTLRILRNVLRDKDARSRVLAMRSVFKKNSRILRGVALVAHKPEENQ